ncbi:MAG: sigma-54-dependent Fis family transcriptional regulator [Verrucomicrobia bacterium]|nr:sigma-54-dependent Fis family transcriptional regulator [Verrucomicrobiota bacterium]
MSGSYLAHDNRPLVCVVDDELSIRESLSSLLRSAGLNVETFSSAEEFLTNARFEALSCLLVDVQLPGITGLDLQQKLLISEIKVPIIFLTGHGDVPIAVRAVKARAVEFLTKPFDDEYLLETTRSAIARYTISRQTREKNANGGLLESARKEGALSALRHEPEIVMSLQGGVGGTTASEFGGIIGQGRAWREIVSQIELVAPTDATVLVLGETGTGKELIARELHRHSLRKAKPLVLVNCASIPTELYESEFFGHAKGAFTSAVRDRIGRFEAADGGTLFLDEVGEIPLELQSKLLRVLQEKSYERVGETRTRTADVRVVAATNRDLKKEMAAHRFREDLYYRLNVFPIKVAPLRDRKEDIPLLTSHFVEVAVRELGCQRPRLTRAGLETLLNYDWPGNVRELGNVIHRSAIFAQGGALEFDLPIAGTPADLTSPRSVPTDHEQGEYLTDAEMRRRERENLFVVLQKTGWKIKGVHGAAELLGVRPTTLMSRIEKLGLRRPPAPE